jgi:hypothetical protein
MTRRSLSAGIAEDQTILHHEIQHIREDREKIETMKILAKRRGQYLAIHQENFKERWLKALESGEYAQTEGFLCREGEGFCCLGVACELAGMVAHDRGADGIFYAGKSGVAPANIVKRLHLRDESGTAVGGAGFVGLAVANDKGTTFAEIAAFCRKHPEAVFTNFERSE